MVKLIAIHTVHYLAQGKPATALPGTQFDMPASEVDSLIVRGAASYADPADASPALADVATAAVVIPAGVQTPVETAPAETEIVPLDADAVLADAVLASSQPAPAPKRARTTTAE